MDEECLGRQARYEGFLPQQSLCNGIIDTLLVVWKHTSIISHRNAVLVYGLLSQAVGALNEIMSENGRNVHPRTLTDPLVPNMERIAMLLVVFISLHCSVQSKKHCFRPCCSTGLQDLIDDIRFTLGANQMVYTDSTYSLCKRRNKLVHDGFTFLHLIGQIITVLVVNQSLRYNLNLGAHHRLCSLSYRYWQQTIIQTNGVIVSIQTCRCRESLE